MQGLGAGITMERYACGDQGRIDGEGGLMHGRQACISSAAFHK